MHNKLENNYVLANKKALYMTMRNYYQAVGQDMMDHMPITFHIK